MKSILSLILISASIAFFVFFTKPKLSELSQNRIEVEKLNVAQENAKKLKSRIDALLKVKNSITEVDLQKITNMIPNSVENVKLIIDFDNMLQSLVSEKGTGSIYRNTNPQSQGPVSIENPRITQSDTNINGDFDTSQLGVADFAFTVALTYSDFIDFLKRIESSTRIFDVESISFSTPTLAPGVNPNNIVYNFNIVLKTYWLKSK